LLPIDEESCIRNLRKYSDTVTILAALYELFSRNKTLGRYVGVEIPLHTVNNEKAEPDFVTLYDDDNKGMLFELKWSLPNDPKKLGEKLKKIEKYFKDFIDWRNSSKKVEHQDVILVCHIMDVNKLIIFIKSVWDTDEFKFLKSENFSIWGWSIVPSKRGEREEELRISKHLGNTKNTEMEKLIGEPAGLLISQKVLEFLRWRYYFIKEKPPVQYTIIILLQHIFSAFPLDEWKESYKIDLETIYDRTQNFFPSWRDYDKNTIQLKKMWLREALRVMKDLNLIKESEEGLYEIPIPVFRPRGDVNKAICKKIMQFVEKRQKRRVKTSRSLVKSKPVIEGPLDRLLFKKSPK